MLYHASPEAYECALRIEVGDFKSRGLQGPEGRSSALLGQKMDSHSTETLQPLKHLRPDIIFLTRGETIIIEAGFLTDHSIVSATRKWRRRIQSASRPADGSAWQVSEDNTSNGRVHSSRLQQAIKISGVPRCQNISCKASEESVKILYNRLCKCERQ